MRHIKTYETITIAAAQKKNKEERELATVLFDVMKNNGFSVYGKPQFSVSSWNNIQLNLPAEVGAIAQYYQSLLIENEIIVQIK